MKKLTRRMRAPFTTFTGMKVDLLDLRVPFTTFTGRKVDLLDLRAEDVCIEDIAHHLALVNRFGGATRVPYSVAQHSVYVARVVEQRAARSTALAALLHDASEAYLGDVVKWLKHSFIMDNYRGLEDDVQRVINRTFGLKNIRRRELIFADRLMVRFEGSRLLPRMDVPEEWQASFLPLDSRERALVGAWQPWSWRTAEEVFLGTFRRLAVVED